MKKTFRLAAAAVALVAASCGGNPPGPPTLPSGELPAGVPIQGAGAWRDDMPDGAKAAFMKAIINPQSKALFAAHDPAKYGDFGCKTCHGPNMAPHPSKFLPHLTFKDGNIVEFATKPAISKFMAEKLTPAMAAAFGKPPFDPKTHQGFGCGGCHVVDMK